MAKRSNKSYPEAMALSDRERRLLAEMEAALASDDPRLQSTLSGDTATLIRRAPGGALAGVAIIVAGIAILFGGLISQVTLLGVAGFIVALTGLILVLRTFAGKAAGNTGGKAAGIGKLRGPKAPRSLGARLQERWDRRTFE
jgi:hypothetical protein